MLNVIFFSDKGWKVLQDKWQKSWKYSLEIFKFFISKKKNYDFIIKNPDKVGLVLVR